MNNSMTVLPELLPILIDMVINNENGTINLVNPGYINHNEILEMYKEIIDPNFTWNNMTLEEQDNILLAKRSNNILNTNKLEKLYPNVNNIKDSIKNLFNNIKK
jgi:3,5-epimerase/4-reductase